MDLTDTPAEAAFRKDLKAWLAGVLPTLGEKPDQADWAGRRTYDTAWQRMLFDAGYAGVGWPGEDGTGASYAEQLIFSEELERAHAPYVGVNFVGLLHAGPTVAVEGTLDQKKRYLPPILKGEEVWCQGFSEPNAGSDLASLRTSAVRDGDDYIVNGSKIWTSHAEVADQCELLVRTSGDRHHGITWLIMPMDVDGIDIRPLKTMTGTDEFAELYLDNVRVPISHRVGEEGDGWRVTMVTLGFERGTAFVGELIESMELLREIAKLDESAAVEVGEIAAELDGLWALVRRNVSGSTPPTYGSVFKLAFSELRQRIGELIMNLLGADGFSFDDHQELIDVWTNSFSRTIAAGTSQIQRNIVAERILGLPK